MFPLVLGKMKLPNAKLGLFCVVKGGTAPLGLIFEDFVHFLKKKKAISDKVSYGSGQKCSKELKNHSFTSVDTIVVKLQ